MGQPTLDLKPNIQLPGPQFQSRPGWGGQLAAWWHKHGILTVFRVLLLVILLFVVRSFQITPEETPADQQSSDTMTLTAGPGQSYTTLARQALDTYRAVADTHIDLDAAQILFIVTTLAQRYATTPLIAGQEVLFSFSDMATLVQQAQNLSPSQHTAWQRLVR